MTKITKIIISLRNFITNKFTWIIKNKPNSFSEYLLILYFIGITNLDSTRPISESNIIIRCVYYFIKYLSIPVLILIILSQLVYLYYLISFNVFEEKDITSIKYYPKFIKKKLLEIKELSKSPNVNMLIWTVVFLILNLFIMFIITLPFLLFMCVKM
uniref:hypothetical protein n=1 Tax=Singerocybe alboinfundibuliformis TaxID=1346812 RepID=UPI0030FE8D85